MRKPRIVSLLPGATEIVHALGLGERLVGRSHECDYPPQVRRLPSCTLPRLNPQAPSGEIDRQVKSALQQGLSLYHVETETLKALRPDVILTQTQCDVCAVSLAEVTAATADWLGRRPTIVSLAPSRLAEVLHDIQRVAEALKVVRRGRELVARLERRIGAIAEKTAALRDCPSVGCLEWLDPLMAAGHWVPELVALAGGRDVLADAGRPSGWLDWQVLREREPGLLVLMPCGFDLARTRHELPFLAQQPQWHRLAAVKQGQVYFTDGHHFFNRPGPRLVDSLEILAEILHPGHFRFGHEGIGWQRQWWKIFQATGTGPA